MNRAEFISRLGDELKGLPMEERHAAVKYYEEYFEEAGPEREDEIVAELGSPHEVAVTILRDYSSVPIVTDRVQYGHQAAAEQGTANASTAGAAQSAQSDAQAKPKEQQSWRFWESWNLPTWVWIVIFICAAPMLLSLLGVVLGLVTGGIGLFAGLVAAVFGAIAAVFFGFLAVLIAGVAVVIGGISAIVSGIVAVVPSPALGVLLMGLGAILLSIGLLVTVLGYWLAVKLLPRATRAFVDMIRRIVGSVKARLGNGGKTV